MKHDKTEPCAQCPLRKRCAAGWLGSYTPELIVEQIRLEVPFPCHMTINYEDPEWRLSIFIEDTKVQACAGYLIMMRKMAKLPRDPEVLAHCERLDRQHPAVFDNHFKFIEYHKGKNYHDIMD